MKSKFLKSILSVLFVLCLVLPLYAATKNKPSELESEIQDAKDLDLSGSDVEKKIKAGDESVLMNIKFETSFIEFREEFNEKMAKAKEYLDTLVISEHLYGVKAYRSFLGGLKNKTPRVRQFCARELAKIYFYKYKKIASDEAWSPAGLAIDKKSLMAMRQLLGTYVNNEPSYPTKIMMEKAKRLITRILFWNFVVDKPTFLRTISRDTFAAFAEHIDLFPSKTAKGRNKYFRDPIVRASDEDFADIRKLLLIPDKILVNAGPSASVDDDNIEASKSDETEEVEIKYEVSDYNIEINEGADVDYLKLAPIDTFGKDRIENLRNGLKNQYIYVRYKCAKRLYELVILGIIKDSDPEIERLKNVISEAYRSAEAQDMDYAALYWAVLLKAKVRLEGIKELEKMASKAGVDLVEDLGDEGSIDDQEIPIE